MIMDPKKRMTAADALDHDYLWQPEPKKPEEYVIVILRDNYAAGALLTPPIPFLFVP